jgi:predicted MFS family arabinose efflux permease
MLFCAAMRLLRQRSLAALLAAEVVSTTGAQMTWLALPWFVLTTTGSPARMGIVMAVELCPLALFGIVSGSVVERVGARRAMLACDLARAPIMALVPLLHWLGALSFPLLLALVFLLGIFWAPYFSSQRIILPELVGDDESVLAQANALFQGATRLTLVLGPAVAGVLLGVVGPVTVLLLDAATYLVAFVLVAAFVPSGQRAPERDDSRGVLAGVRFLLGDRLLGPLTATNAVVEMVFQALVAAVPVLVFVRYGADARIVGWLFASWGAGSFAGNLAVYRIVERFPLLPLACVGGLLQALAVWPLVAETPATLAGAALFVLGVCNGLAAAPLFGILTARTPPHLRAKVITASLTLGMLAGPLGLAVAGPALQELGTQPVLAAIAVVWTTAAVAFLLVALRRRNEVSVPGRAAPAASGRS